MVEWWWLIVAVIGGFVIGLMALVMLLAFLEPATPRDPLMPDHKLRD